jgi:hypothetical protein
MLNSKAVVNASGILTSVPKVKAYVTLKSSREEEQPFKTSVVKSKTLLPTPSTPDWNETATLYDVFLAP